MNVVFLKRRWTPHDGPLVLYRAEALAAWAVPGVEVERKGARLVKAPPTRATHRITSVRKHRIGGLVRCARRL